MSTLMNLDYLIRKERIDLSFSGLHDGNIDVLVEVLRTSKVLAQLNLYSNLIALSDDKFTNALAANATLEVLSLGSNQIGGEGGKRLAAALKVNESLRELHVGSNRIGDEGAKGVADALTTNDSLQMIGLYGNNIGDEGAESLADAFPLNRALRVLWLHENRIGDDAARRMAESLGRNCAIEKMFLLGNRISEEVEEEVQLVVGDIKGRVERQEAMRVQAEVGERELAATKNKQQSEENDKKRNDEELASRDAEIALLKEEVQCKDEAIAMKDEELKAKDEEIAALKLALEALKSSSMMHNVSPPITVAENIFSAKDAKIMGLGNAPGPALEAPFDDARDDLPAANDDPLSLEIVASTE